MHIQAIRDAHQAFITHISFSQSAQTHDEIIQALVLQYLQNNPGFLPVLSDWLNNGTYPCLEKLDEAIVKTIAWRFCENCPEKDLATITLFLLSKFYPSIQEVIDGSLQDILEVKNKDFESMLGSLLANPSPVHDECRFNLSSIYITPSMAASFQSILRKKWFQLCKIQKPIFSICIENQSLHELEMLVLLINQLDISTRPVVLELTAASLQNVGIADKFFYLIEGIQNSNLVNYAFPRTAFGQNPKFFESLAGYLLNKKNLAYVDFSGSLLEGIEYRVFQNSMAVLAAHTNASCITVDFSNNNFHGFGLDFLIALQDLHFQKLKFIFFNSKNSDAMQAIQAYLSGSSVKNNYKLASLYFQTIFNEPRDTFGRIETGKIVHFKLADSEWYDILNAQILDYKNKSDPNKVLRILLIIHRELKWSAALITKLLKRCIELDLYVSWTIYEFNLNFEDRLNLFLHDCYHNNGLVSNEGVLIEQYDVYCMQNLPGNILSSWRNVFLTEESIEHIARAKEDVIYRNPMCLIQPEEDNELIALRIRERVLPHLKKIISSVDFSKIPFFKTGLSIIESHKGGVDNSLALMNMTSWFTFVSAVLLHQHPDMFTWLSEESSATHTHRKMKRDPKTTVNQVLQTILDLANPKLRYRLTHSFFEMWSVDHNQLYFSLVENSVTDALLPMIPLCQIVLQSTQIDRSRCIEQVKDILLSVHFRQFEGHHFRTLVAGFLSLVNDSTVAPLEKLTLVSKILGHTQRHRNIENLLKTFLRSEKNLPQVLEHKPCTESGMLLRELILFCKEPDTEDILDKIRLLDRSFYRALLPILLQSFEKNAKLRTLVKHCLGNFLPQYFAESEFKQTMSHLIMIQGLSGLDKLGGFCGLNQENFNDAIPKIFKELFSLTDEQFSFYPKVFEGRTNESGLLTYFSKIRSLPPQEFSKISEIYTQFIADSLSEGSAVFYERRYAKDSNIHLRTVFENRAFLEQSWRAGDVKKLDEFIKQDGITYQEYRPNFPVFIRKKIFEHGHIDKAFYLQLKHYLEANTITEKARIKDEVFALQKSLEATQDAHVTRMVEYQHAVVQSELIQLLETPIPDLPGPKKYIEHLRILSKIQRALSISIGGERPQFLLDITALMRGLKNNRTQPEECTWSEWVVTDTDDLWSLFMAGTDVEGSCQAIDGDPHLNKCLMAYVMDGKNRLLAIQDPSKKTVGRCMLRILWDKTQNTPVLFMEEVYPGTLRSDLRSVLEHFAISRAKQLGIPLLSLESTMDSYQYSGSVESLASVAPWEYVDAIYSVADKGVFTIPTAQVLYSPDLDVRLGRLHAEFSLPSSEGALKLERGQAGQTATAVIFSQMVVAQSADQHEHTVEQTLPYEKLSL